MSIGSLSENQQGRLRWLSLVIVLVGVALIIRLAIGHLYPMEGVDAFGDGYRRIPDSVPAARGDILDCNGHSLAVSKVSYRVDISPPPLEEAEIRIERSATLAPILGRPIEEISQTLATNDASLCLGHDLPQAVGQELMDLGWYSLDINLRFPRVYPEGPLAAPVLGFVNYDGEANYGVEAYYDNYLRGQPGVSHGVRDRLRELVLVSEAGYQPPRDGFDLVLTIDRNVQYRAEALLQERIARHKAESGNLIVLHVESGAILAMTNWPSYEPARFGAPEFKDQWANTSISWMYEPGSVFKLLTMGAALDAQVVNPDSVYDDRGQIRIGDQTITNSDGIKQGHGITTMTELLAYSRNVGSVYVADLIGETRFYEVMRRFGFGEITGVDMGFETEGIMYVPGDANWSKSNLATNSYGQGIAVSPLQVAAAFGVMANEGMLMRPYIVQEAIAPARTADRPDVQDELASLRLGSQRVRQVISPEAARQATEMAVNAVEMGMTAAMVPGYQVAGKSGTAGVPTEEGYQGRDVIASFVGYGPIPDPQFVVLIKLDSPTKGVWGVETAAPAFSEMMQFLFDYYGIPPTEPVD